MSALWAEDFDVDVPVPWVLTDVGWAATRETVTVAEAAVLAGIGVEYVRSEARYGSALPGLVVGGRWLLDRAAVEAWAAARRARSRPVALLRLPSAPLLQLVEGRGGARACGVVAGSGDDKALERAAKDGRVTVWAADHLAVAVLGLTPWEVWGAAYDA